MTDSLAKKTRTGILWNAGNILFSKSFRIITSIILARLLFPEDFGLYGIALIIIRLARKFTSLGFGAVIVQRKEITGQEINTIFTVSLSLNIGMALGLYFTAPLFADWVGEPRVTPLVHLISVTFLMASFILTAENILKRKLKFKALSLSRSISSIVQYSVPIILALLNFGVWSLILGEVLGTLATMTAALLYARWTPKIYFKLNAFKNVYAYGLKVSVVSYLEYFINNVDYLLISKFLGAAQLGFYERAFNLMNLTRRQLGNTINESLFSAYSKISDDKERVVKNIGKVLNYVSLIAYPVLIWLFFAAPSLIINLYGDKWQDTVIPLQIMCASGIINTIAMVFSPVIFALDLTAFRIKAQLIYLTALTGFIYILIPYGINGVAFGVVAATSINTWLLLRIMSQKLNFGFSHFFATQKTPLLYGSIQILFSLITIKTGQMFFSLSSIPMFFLVSAATVLAFALSHLILKKDDYQSLLNEARSVFKRKTVKATAENKSAN